jgi:hypothetical protein
VSASKPGITPSSTPASPAKFKPPTTPPMSDPNARLNAKRAQSTLTSPMEKKFCMSMASTWRDRTIPP